MTQALRRPHLPKMPALTLNTDGRSHPRENTLTALTALSAAVALACAFSASLHVTGSWVGLVGVATGLYGQMISATTPERVVLVISLGGSAVGLGLNVAHGGLLF